MKKENFTSNLSKLYANIENLLEFRNTGILRPITLDISPTNRCNLNCPFCSVKNRDQSLFLSLYQVNVVMGKMINLGLKSIVLTGGGEPTLWPYFKEFVESIKIIKFPIGLITNGLMLHTFKKEILETFTWIRVSLNGMDNGWFPDFDIPKNVDLSFNYVWHNGTDYFKIRDKIKKVLQKYPQTQSIKIQQDVFEKVDIFKQELNHFFQDDRVFIDKKNQDVPQKCYMGWIKPHLDADGNIYRCSTMVLRHDPRFVVGQFNNYTLKNDAKEFDTSKCDICFFKTQNDFIDSIGKKFKHENFI